MEPGYDVEKGKEQHIHEWEIVILSDYYHSWKAFKCKECGEKLTKIYCRTCGTPIDEVDVMRAEHQQLDSSICDRCRAINDLQEKVEDLTNALKDVKNTQCEIYDRVFDKVEH